MDKTKIGDLAEKLAASLPEGLRAVKADLENNFKVVLEAGLRANIAFAHACGGRAKCSTCRIWVVPVGFTVPSRSRCVC